MFCCFDKSKLNCYEMKTYVEGFSSVEKIQWKFWVKLFFIQIQFSPFPLTDTDKVFGCSQGGQEQPPNKCQLLVLCDICTASLKRPPGRKKREQIVRVPHCIHTVQLTAPSPWHLRPQFVGDSLLEPLENLSWEPHRSFIVLFHCRENHSQIGTDRDGWWKSDLHYSSLWF